MRAAVLLHSLVLFFSPDWMFVFTFWALFRLEDLMVTREVKH